MTEEVDLNKIRREARAKRDKKLLADKHAQEDFLVATGSDKLSPGNTARILSRTPPFPEQVDAEASSPPPESLDIPPLTEEEIAARERVSSETSGPPAGLDSGSMGSVVDAIEQPVTPKESGTPVTEIASDAFDSASQITSQLAAELLDLGVTAFEMLPEKGEASFSRSGGMGNIQESLESLPDVDPATHVEVVHKYEQDLQHILRRVDAQSFEDINELVAENEEVSDFQATMADLAAWAEHVGTEAWDTWEEFATAAEWSAAQGLGSGLMRLYPEYAILNDRWFDENERFISQEEYEEKARWHPYIREVAPWKYGVSVNEIDRAIQLHNHTKIVDALKAEAEALGDSTIAGTVADYLVAGVGKPEVLSSMIIGMGLSSGTIAVLGNLSKTKRFIDAATKTYWRRAAFTGAVNAAEVAAIEIPLTEMVFEDIDSYKEYGWSDHALNIGLAWGFGTILGGVVDAARTSRYRRIQKMAEKGDVDEFLQHYGVRDIDEEDLVLGAMLEGKSERHIRDAVKMYRRAKAGLIKPSDEAAEAVEELKNTKIEAEDELPSGLGDEAAEEANKIIKERLEAESPRRAESDVPETPALKKSPDWNEETVIITRNPKTGEKYTQKMAFHNSFDKMFYLASKSKKRMQSLYAMLAEDGLVIRTDAKMYEEFEKFVKRYRRRIDTKYKGEEIFVEDQQLLDKFVEELELTKRVRQPETPVVSQKFVEEDIIIAAQQRKTVEDIRAELGDEAAKTAKEFVDAQDDLYFKLLECLRAANIKI